MKVRRRKVYASESNKNMETLEGKAKRLKRESMDLILRFNSKKSG